jgi:hypothetical protein
MMIKIIVYTTLFFNALTIVSQTVSKTMLRIPDTGQNTSYTNTFGEDNDFTINVPFFNVKSNIVSAIK